MAETTAIGEALRRARLDRGLAIEAAASATRIAPRHLEALERGDLEALPSGPFGRSYVRSYAEFLGLDPEPMVASYRTAEAAKGLGPAESREKVIRDLGRLLEKRPVKSRHSPVPVIFALVTGSVLLAWVWVSREPPAPSRPQAKAETRQEQEPLRQPVPIVAPPAPTPEPARRRALSVTESALGTEIVDHRLVDRANQFSEGARVAFWTRVLSAKPGEVIHHYWFHEGRPVMRTELPLGGPHWRTFSRYTLPDGASGNWVVEARDGEGRVLAREEFLCVGKGG